MTHTDVTVPSPKQLPVRAGPGCGGPSSQNLLLGSLTHVSRTTYFRQLVKVDEHMFASDGLSVVGRGSPNRSRSRPGIAFARTGVRDCGNEPISEP
jgi:hypothetical protein